MDDPFSFSSRHIKYWEIFLSWLFKYPTRCYELKKDIQAHRYKHRSQTLYRFGKTYRNQKGSKSIICKVTSAHEDREKGVIILKKIYEDIDHPQLCEWATFEVLAKVIAYRNLKRGDIIPLSIMKDDRSLVLTTYFVDHVFNLWNNIAAFGLISLDQIGAPILLFRGTDFSFMKEEARASIISDLDPQGPGWSLFQNGHRSIHNWLQQKNQLARTVGHSLGGIIATYVLIHESQAMSLAPHESSYAFNFPGIAPHLIDKWNRLAKKPRFTGFVCRGDLISKLGKLFGDVYEISFTNPLSPIRAHEILLFAQQEGSIQPIDIDKENRCPSRQLYSKLQQKTSSILYKFGLRLLFPDECDP